MKILLVITTLFIFSGCSSSEKDKDRIISMMSADLKNSQESIDRDTRLVLQYLKDKATDPITAEKAKVIEEKAIAMLKILDKPFELTKLESPDDKSLSLLSEQIAGSASNLKKMNEDRSGNLEKEITSLSSLVDSFQVFKKKSLNENKNLSEIVSVRISRLKNAIAHFYDSMISDGRGMISFDQRGVLVSQNVKHLYPGEILEVSAGVGNFDADALQKVTVNGTELARVSGTAIYKTMANQPGKHTIKVGVSFLDEAGKPQKGVFDVDYFVDLPCPQNAN